MEKSYQSFSTVGSVLLVLSIVLLTNTVFADDLQTINDKLAIAAVIAQYSYAWDSKDAERFSNLFTEDAMSEVWLPGRGQRVVKTFSRRMAFVAPRALPRSYYAIISQSTTVHIVDVETNAST